MIAPWPAAAAVRSLRTNAAALALASSLSAGLACSAAAPPTGVGSSAPLRAADAAHAATPADASGYQLRERSSRAFPFQQLAGRAAETRLARLSHSQYRNSLQDLLGMAQLPDLVLAPDALNGFGFETSNAFRVDPRLGPQYRAVAETLAERVVQDAESFARVVPCAPAAAGCREQFLRSFGERAFRRPLSAEDLAAFSQRFELGAQLYQSGDDFRDGVRLSIEMLLQAPEFLYRMQAPRGPTPSSLDDYEVAARLAYFLYDSMPDAALFAAARAGQLHTPDQVEGATRRMLKESRVLDGLVAFHEQVWQFDRFAAISPDAAHYPSAPASLVWHARHAARRFVRDVLQHGGGLEELLTAPYAYVDPGLAPLYGVAGSAELRDAAAGHFARVRFDPNQRRGLLMQVGYLAANAYSIRTDPIHRGLFVIRNLLCREVPDPPPGATTTPPPATDQPIVTTRDEVSLVTGQSFCPTCHREINAPGFAFEGFDAVGQRRDTDNGAAVDSSGQMFLDGQLVHFDGASQLVELLARSQEAHRCYTRRWMEYAYGRALAETDLPTLDGIAAESRPIAEILVAIVRSSEFLSP